MSKPTDFKTFYFSKLRAIRNFVLPDPTELQDAGSSLARGAIWALATAFITASITVAIVELTGLILPFDSAVRFGLAIAIGASGGLLDFSGFNASFASVGSLAVGIHSGTIALAIFLVARRYGRRAGRSSSRSAASQANGKFSIYLGLGFASFNFLSMLLAQGSIHFASATAKISPLSILGASFGGILIGLSAYIGFRSVKKSLLKGASTFDFAISSIWNFFAIYGVFLIIATVVFIIQFVIQPNFSESYQTGITQPPMNYPANQVAWAVAAFVAFLPNVLMQVFFFCAGFTNDPLSSSSGLEQYLGGLGQGNSLLQSAGWPIYVAVMFLVLLTALISGAVASASTGYTPKAPGRSVALIAIVTMVVTFVSYLSSVEGHAFLYVGEKIEFGLWIGASVVSGLVFATLLGSISYWASTSGRSFAGAAFSQVIKLRRVKNFEVPQNIAGKIFGIFVAALLTVSAFTPIGAATLNRVWATTADGPSQVADQAIKNLETMSLKDLKAYLNTTSSSLPWLSDTILESARPKASQTAKVILTNAIGKPWQVGNLDASILIKFTSSTGTAFAKWPIETSSELTNPSWLIKHPVYTANILNPTVTIQKANYLTGLKDFRIVVNGEEVTPGDYQLIPGFYSIQAPGYKLVAPTDLTYATSGLNSTFVIGTKVNLPAGGAYQLDSAINKSAESCAKLSADGNSACFTNEDVYSRSKIQSGVSMPEAFDLSWTDFKASNTSCISSKRVDVLVSATSLKSKGKCSTEVTYTENYFDSKEIQVPHYTSKDVCVAGYTDDYGNPATYVGSYFGSAVYVANGTYYYQYQLTYDGCATTRTETVQDGWDSKTVRGKLIGKSTWAATVPFTRNVVGHLADDNTFSVK